MMASDLAKRGCGKVLLLHSEAGKGDYRGAWEVSYPRLEGEWWEVVTNCSRLEGEGG